MLTWIRLSVITVFLFMSFTLEAAPEKVRVIRVIDGDTIVVLSNNHPVKVRLKDIDAPEMGQPYGKKSKKALSKKIFKVWLDLDNKGKDHYGRTLGTLYRDGEDINLYMVKNGHAWVYRHYTNDSGYLKAEEIARLQRLGIWKLPKSQQTAPWEWRKHEKDRNK